MIRSLVREPGRTCQSASERCTCSGLEHWDSASQRYTDSFRSGVLELGQRCTGPAHPDVASWPSQVRMASAQPDEGDSAHPGHRETRPSLINEFRPSRVREIREFGPPGQRMSAGSFGPSGAGKLGPAGLGSGFGSGFGLCRPGTWLSRPRELFLHFFLILYLFISRLSLLLSQPPHNFEVPGITSPTRRMSGVGLSLW